LALRTDRFGKQLAGRIPLSLVTEPATEKKGKKKLMTIKSKLFMTGATLAFSGFLALTNPTETQAAELTPSTWVPRTVEEVKNDIKALEQGSKYTFQWGDTLSAIASATEIPLKALTDVNDIANADLIMAGNSIHLSKDNTVVTVEQNEEVKSYDVSQEEVVEVETPAEVVEEYKAPEQPVVQEVPQTAPATPAASASQGYTMNVEATAYSTNQPSLSDFTFTGINLRENPNVVAVDPNVIPLGSTIIVPGYGTYVAGDTGSAIKGNRIDVHITDLNQAIAFGRKSIQITIIP